MRQYPQKGGTFVRQEDGSLAEHRSLPPDAPIADPAKDPAPEPAPAIPQPIEPTEDGEAALGDPEE